MLGRKRQTDNTKAGRRDFNGAGNGSRKGELIHIVGALGEVAVARALGLPFDPHERGIYRHGSDDLRAGLEVRTRGRRRYDRMFVHEKDRPGLLYIHAKLDAPELLPDGTCSMASREVDVVGWITHEEMLQVRERVDFGTPNWACRESHLHPIDDLPRLDL